MESMKYFLLCVNRMPLPKDIKHLMGHVARMRKARDEYNWWALNVKLGISSYAMPYWNRVIQWQLLWEHCLMPRGWDHEWGHVVFSFNNKMSEIGLNLFRLRVDGMARFEPAHMETPDVYLV